MGPDRDFTRQQVAKFSARDAVALPRYEAMLERIARFVEPTLLETPPNLWSLRPRDLARMATLAWRFARLGKDAPRALEVLTGAARPILDRWFEAEELQATLATDAIIGALALPSMPGTAYVLFHHVMGETGGVRGVWGYARGGMGEHQRGLGGGRARTWRRDAASSPVANILTHQGRVTGVALEDGTTFKAPRVVLQRRSAGDVPDPARSGAADPEFVKRRAERGLLERIA